jgi:uncharacterized RDD family membrane protein YckC
MHRNPAKARPLPLQNLVSERTPSLKRRMACWAYEGLLLFGVAFVAAYLFSALTQTRHALDNRHALQAFLFMVMGIYFTWFGAKGQTLAMKTWHIQLVACNGKALNQGRALMRYLLSWVWFLPSFMLASLFKASPLWMACAMLGWIATWALASQLRTDRQFWHDVWAGSRLIQTRI